MLKLGESAVQEQDARSQAHGIIAAAQADADKCIAEARHEALVAAASVPSAVDALAPARLARLPSFLRDRITGRRTSSGASPHSPAGQPPGGPLCYTCNIQKFGLGPLSTTTMQVHREHSLEAPVSSPLQPPTCEPCSPFGQAHGVHLCPLVPSCHACDAQRKRPVPGP